MKRLFPGMALAWAGLLSAQQPRIEPSLGIAQAEYHQAQEAWLHTDPDLSLELFSGNPAEMHKRIRRVAALRDDVMEKKGVYLDLIVKRFSDMRARLGAGNPELPVSELKKGLLEEQSLLLGDQERVESLIRDLPQGDEYALVMRELNNERTGLISLQNALALRLRTIDKIDASQRADKEIEAKDPLDKRLEAIERIWQEERAKTKEQRAKWANLYSSMDREIDRGAVPPPIGPAPGKGTRNEKQPKGGAPKVEKSSPPVAAVAPLSAGGEYPPAALRSAVSTAGFTGTWVYDSRPGAWVGFGEPVRVWLQLRRSGERISGSYIARLPGKYDVREVALELVGEEVSPDAARLHWVSKEPGPPAEGEMTLQLGGDRRLLVQRDRSDDTYIPLGMEVLVPR